MKYFIYPKAINGLSIADFLDIYFCDNQYCFIDDGDESITLDLIVKDICQDDVVLVASTKNYENIAKKLQERNLRYLDGISWCGEVINQLINEQKEPDRKYVGIVISSHYIESNFANIDENLLQMGYGVVYFVFIIVSNQPNSVYVNIQIQEVTFVSKNKINSFHTLFL